MHLSLIREFNSKDLPPEIRVQVYNVYFGIQYLLPPLYLFTDCLNKP